MPYHPLNANNVIGDSSYQSWLLTNFKGFATYITGQLNPSDFGTITATELYKEFNNFLSSVIEMNTSVINSSKISEDNIISYSNVDLKYPDTINDGAPATASSYRNLIYRITPTFSSGFDSKFSSANSIEYYKLWQKYLNNAMTLNNAIILAKKWDEGQIPS